MADIVIEYKLIIIRNHFCLFILREVDIIQRFIISCQTLKIVWLS